jgi:putative transposase
LRLVDRLVGQLEATPRSGLHVPTKRRKKRLSGVGVQVGAMQPIRPDVLWALDFQFDTLANGRTIKLLNVIDEFTRECLASEVDRSIDADHVVNVPYRIVAERGAAPVYVRFDIQWPRVRRSCRCGLVPFRWHRQCVHRPRLARAERLDRVVQRQPRDELLNGWQFDSLLEARVIINGGPTTTGTGPTRPRRPHPQRVRPQPDHPNRKAA